MSDPFLPYARQTVEEDDVQAVAEVLRSPFLTTGPKVKEFEAALAALVGAKEAVAVSSGTAGLHLALLAAGVGPGDEVLVPALSFAATANAALYVGARPVFVDSLPGRFNLDPADAARKVTAKTKAVIPVHFAGEPVDLEAIHALAVQRGLIVVEDAAHALGARRAGRSVGNLSAMTVFSFHPVKHVTTGEGGAVMTSDPALARKLRRLRHHGIDVDAVERDAKRQWRYDMADLGYNYRITDIQCALGLSQLRKLERFMKDRERVAALYEKLLGGDPRWELPSRVPDGDRHARHLYVLRLKGPAAGRRDEIFAGMRRRGVGAHVHYLPIYKHSFYQKAGYGDAGCPELEKTFPGLLTIPMFPAMTDDDARRAATALRDAADEAR